VSKKGGEWMDKKVKKVGVGLVKHHRLEDWAFSADFHFTSQFF
jgi:hypothetical protein